MPFAAILTSALTWIFREIVVKFLVFAAILALILLLWPIVKTIADPFVNFDAINNALGGMPAGVWYFLSLFRIDIGLPMVVSAFVARFVIRRIPVVG